MRSRLWVLLGVALLAAGCGPASDLPELGTVSGVVTLDGETLAGVSVKFVPESGRTSSAVTDAGGKYELVYSPEAKGAIVGEHTVYVSGQGEGGEGGGNPNEESEGGGAAVEPYTGTIPAKYNEESTLKKTVEAGANTIDLELTSD